MLERTRSRLARIRGRSSTSASSNRSPAFSTRIRIPETIRYLKPLNSKSPSKIAL